MTLRNFDTTRIMKVVQAIHHRGDVKGHTVVMYVTYVSLLGII